MIERGFAVRIENNPVSIEINRAVINSNTAHIESAHAVSNVCGLSGNCGSCRFRQHCINFK